MVSFPPNSGYVTPIPYVPPPPTMHMVGVQPSYGYNLPAYYPSYQTNQGYYPRYPSMPAYNQAAFQPMPYQPPSPTSAVMPPSGDGLNLPMPPVSPQNNGDVSGEIGKVTGQHAIGGFQGFLRGMVIALVPAAIAGGFALWHGLKRGIGTGSLVGQVALITGICLGLGGSAGATLAVRREFQDTLRAKGGNPLRLFDPNAQAAMAQSFPNRMMPPQGY